MLLQPRSLEKDNLNLVITSLSNSTCSRLFVLKAYLMCYIAWIRIWHVYLRFCI
jgi:hypothetical protein